MAQSAVGAEVAGPTLDRDLVALAAAGDRDAYDQLLNQRLVSCYHTALGILRNEAEAQDAVQDACVRAWRHLRSLRDPELFDAWLGRILVNSCRARLQTRRRSRVREIDLSTYEEGDRPVSSGGRAVDERVVEADAIRRAFDRLKPDDRILLSLHHADGRSIDEIAALLGIPSGTAKWRLHAARRSLETALGRER